MGISSKILGPAAMAHYKRQKHATNAAESAAISTRIKKGKRDSAADAQRFVQICAAAGVEKPELEYRFNESRMWRMDFAWPRHRLALEVDGGVFIPGGAGHNRGASVRKDHEKGNSAACMGWRVLHAFPEKLLKFETVEMVRRALRASRLASSGPVSQNGRAAQ